MRYNPWRWRTQALSVFPNRRDFVIPEKAGIQRFMLQGGSGFPLSRERRDKDLENRKNLVAYAGPLQTSNGGKTLPVQSPLHPPQATGQHPRQQAAQDKVNFGIAVTKLLRGRCRRPALRFSARRRLGKGLAFGLRFVLAPEPGLHFRDNFGATLLPAFLLALPPGPAPGLPLALPPDLVQCVLRLPALPTGWLSYGRGTR